MIQLFTPTFRIEECLAEIRECLEKGWTGLGFKTVQFEDKFKEYVNLPHAHFLSSNTVGLVLAFELFKRRYNWQDGDEVITTPLTFVSTNHAILEAGLTPVFADVDEYLCLDPKSVAARITPKTKAVIFVGIGGNTARYQEVLELCKQHNLRMILDAAHMCGTRFDNRHIGYDADCTVFSFQAVKNLPTADSGMICFADREDDVRVRKLTWLGIDKDTYSRTAAQGAYKWMYEVEELGYKAHGNSIMAAIGLVQLKYVDTDNAYRRQIAKWYADRFDKSNIRYVHTAPGCESAQHLFQIRVKNRDELMMAMNKHDIFPGVHYRDNTEYTLYRKSSGTCENAAVASREIISLPLHVQLSKKDVDMVADTVIRYAR